MDWPNRSSHVDLIHEVKIRKDNILLYFAEWIRFLSMIFHHPEGSKLLNLFVLNHIPCLRKSPIQEKKKRKKKFITSSPSSYFYFFFRKKNILFPFTLVDG